MIMLKPGRLLASAAFAGLLAFAAAPANAATATCDEAGIDDALLANLDCQVGEGSGNVDALINSEEFFGPDDWTNVGKEDSADFGDAGAFGDWDLNFVGTNNDDTKFLEGTWSIDVAIWLEFEDVMIILKDGSDAEPGAFIGYLLVSGDDDGTYTSPFCNIVTANCTGDDIKAISFGGLYARGEAPPGGDPPEIIPLPAALPIFLITLGGAAWFARRNRPA